MPETILIVDDNRWSRDLVRAALEGDGHTLITAASGEEALEIAGRTPIDVVVLDLMMSGIGGIEVASRLRTTSRTAEVGILCLTGADDVEHRVLALRNGADDLIGKPVHGNELRTRVNLLLRKREAAHDMRESLSRLQRLETWKDDLVHMIIHDMGNVLAGTVGYLELALSAPGLDPAVARDVESAQACARGVQRMLADVMDLRRLEEGRLPLARTPIDVESLIREEMETLFAVAAARRKKLEIAVEPGLPPMHADRGLVGRVLTNLVTNAVKHSGKGRTVTIGALAGAGGTVALFVDDEGPGIAAEVRRRLFEKFVTGAAEGSGAERGRGLGLAFCKVAVEAHGGTIQAQPREPVGTRFLVELPTPPDAA